jgi:hypothetical protein
MPRLQLKLKGENSSRKKQAATLEATQELNNTSNNDED